MKNKTLQRIFKYILPTEINNIMSLLSYNFNPWKNYIKDIFSYVGNAKIINNFNCDNPLLMVLTLQPLPNKMLNIFHDNNMEKIIYENGVWKFKGTNIGQNRCIIGNCSLPNTNTSHIPFPFSYLHNNKRNIVSSNIFYWEIELEKEAFRAPWPDSCVSIGFGHLGTNILKQIGWEKNTIGYHSDDGYIFHENTKIDNFKEYWSAGDIIGAGIIYKEDNINDLFFTKNGKIIHILKNINLSGQYYPMLCLDSFYGAKVNFGEKQFCYPIHELIKNNNNGYIISSKNDFLEKNYDLNYYKWIPSIEKKYFILKLNNIIKKLINVQLMS